jgi:hypothetical protein
MGASEMNKGKMSVPVYLAQPGSEGEIHKKGFRLDALVDTGADISIVSPAIVEQVYGEKSTPYGLVIVQGFDGRQSVVKTVPLTVGLESEGGQLITVQIDCLQADIEGLSIGADVLSLLGLSLTFDYKRNQVVVERYTWESFEDEVATIYRALGATVKQNVNLAGFQLDMVVTETTPSKQPLRLAVECKFYKDRVGNRIINDFSRIIETLKQTSLIDRGVVVSSSGFTQDASLVAKQSSIELLTIDDLRQAVAGRDVPGAKRHEGDSISPADVSPSEKGKRIPHIFVVMPFTPELDDVYHLGIREVATNLGVTCERADEMQYVGGVVEKIYDLIRDSDLIVAEVTTPNPNVYYEVGFAHALQKPVVLLTQDVQATPFDLRAYNHIIYSSIVELRSRLEIMLDHIMHLSDRQEKSR